MPDHDPVTPEVLLRHPVTMLQVRLRLAPSRPSPVEGILFWLPPRLRRFNLTDSARFFIDPAAAPEIVLRVPPELAPQPAPTSRISIWLHLKGNDRSYLQSLSIAEVPPLCSAPPKL